MNNNRLIFLFVAVSRFCVLCSRPLHTAIDWRWVSDRTPEENSTVTLYIYLCTSNIFATSHHDTIHGQSASPEWSVNSLNIDNYSVTHLPLQTGYRLPEIICKSHLMLCNDLYAHTESMQSDTTTSPFQLRQLRDISLRRHGDEENSNLIEKNFNKHNLTDNSISQQHCQRISLSTRGNVTEDGIL